MPERKRFFPLRPSLILYHCDLDFLHYSNMSKIYWGVTIYVVKEYQNIPWNWEMIVDTICQHDGNMGELVKIMLMFSVISGQAEGWHHLCYFTAIACYWRVQWMDQRFLHASPRASQDCFLSSLAPPLAPALAQVSTTTSSTSPTNSMETMLNTKIITNTNMKAILPRLFKIASTSLRWVLALPGSALIALSIGELLQK